MIAVAVERLSLGEALDRLRCGEKKSRGPRGEETRRQPNSVEWANSGGLQRPDVNGSEPPDGTRDMLRDTVVGGVGVSRASAQDVDILAPKHRDSRWLAWLPCCRVRVVIVGVGIIACRTLRLARAQPATRFVVKAVVRQACMKDSGEGEGKAGASRT